MKRLLQTPLIQRLLQKKHVELVDFVSSMLLQPDGDYRKYVAA